MEECTDMVPDEFNFGLTQRKAIYKNYPEALPDVPVVDVDALKDNTAFIEKHMACLSLQLEDEILSLSVGAVLVTTGFDSYEPKEAEFGYKTIPNVITLPEFNRLMEINTGKLVYNKKEIKSVAFIYCVGGRQTKGENKYCSRSCCTSAIHTSLNLKEKFGPLTAYHLFRDIRTYGKQELLYEKSSKQGDIYIRYDEKDPPVIENNGKVTTIKVKDWLTSKQELELEADFVVLVTGMVARNDSKWVSEKFKIPVGADKFFNEIHPKLKPVETVIKGVYIGGSCQGPKNISESVQSSLSGAAKINALLSGGTISLDPIIARVNNDACVWCGKCAEVCEYTAIREIESGEKHIAAVNKAVCTGCGICAPVCPENAIEIAQYTDAEIEGMIDGFMEKSDLPEKTDVVEEKDETEVLKMKEYPQLWKNIRESLNGGKKTVPELSAQLGVEVETVTYNLMTMNKYGVVVADGMDNKEAYYYYKNKN
jgi:heterodisulfide reductase subunit A2